MSDSPTSGIQPPGPNPTPAQQVDLTTLVTGVQAIATNLSLVQQQLTRILDALPGPLVALAAVHGVQGGSLTWNPPATSGTHTNTVTFTAPCAGICACWFYVNDDAATSPGSFSMGITVNGTGIASDTLGSPSWSLSGSLAVAKGTVTIVTSIGPSTNSQYYGRGNYLFIPTP